MKVFRDKTGAEWSIDINVGTIRRVKDLTSVDLLTILEERLLERLVDDPCLLVDVVFAACKPQAEARGVTDLQFGEAMGGEALDGAVDALLEDLVSFFPRRKRETMRKVLEKMKALQNRATEFAAKTIEGDKLDRTLTAQLAKIDRELDAQLARLGESSGERPESAESTPTPSDSAT